MTEIAPWEDRLALLWEEVDTLPAADFVARMDALAAQAPTKGRALFERAGARDSVGQEAEAVELYEQALAAGLSGTQRRQAVIQLASSLRNVGQVERGLALLEAEQQRGPDELIRIPIESETTRFNPSGCEQEKIRIPRYGCTGGAFPTVQELSGIRMSDALSAFLALMLVDSGREREAVATVLTALAPHLPRYQRSVKNYARFLTESA